MIARYFRRLRDRQGMRRKFRIAREWSNRELHRFAPLFTGDVVNVSGWTDEDKQGSHYEKYFSQAESYTVTNYISGSKGLTGRDGEIFLDLEADVPDVLRHRFDVVFNHTTLEHVFECRIAFRNLCLLSRDVVIVVVPYIQQMHGSTYGDFWRFTPQALRRLFEENGYGMRYCSANGADRASIYLFAMGFIDDRWDDRIPERYDVALDETRPLYGPGCRNVIGARVVD